MREKPSRASEAQTIPGVLVASSPNPMWVAPGTQLLGNIGSNTKVQVFRHFFLGILDVEDFEVLSVIYRMGNSKPSQKTCDTVLCWFWA